MSMPTNQQLIIIEGAATYERVLSDLRGLETEEVIRHILDFIKIYPDFAPAHNDIAVLLYQEGNKLKSLAHYEKAHKLDPGNIAYRKNLADFYFVELEWTGDAIHTYLDILKDNPFDTEALNSLGTISLKIGRKEQARQYFSRTLQLDSNNHEATLGLQQLPPPSIGTSDSQPVPQVIAHISNATPQAPVSANAPSFQNLFVAGQTELPRNTDDIYREAISLVEANNPNGAVALLESIVARDSNNAMFHNDLGVLYQKIGNSLKSRQHHEIAVKLEPSSTIFQKNLADLLCSEFGELEAALSIYVKLFADNCFDIELLKAIAHICLEVDKQDDAGFFLEQILSIKPWDQEAADALRTIKTSI